MSTEPGGSQPPRAHHYPPFVSSAEQRRRWDLAEALARALFGDIESPEAAVWQATRSLYRGPLPTGDIGPSLTVGSNWGEAAFRGDNGGELQEGLAAGRDIWQDSEGLLNRLEGL